MGKSAILKDQVFLSIVLGTIFWGFYGLTLYYLLPENLYHYSSWAIVIGIDVLCILYFIFFRSHIKAIDCFTKVITLIQIAYCLHMYDLHVVYLFSMIGLFGVTIPSFVSSDIKYIYAYTVTGMLCGASYFFTNAEYSALIGIGSVIGPLFSGIITVSNKKTRDENITMKVELEQARLYAHEINNPLVIVKASVDRMLSKTDDLDPKDSELLSKAHTNIDRIADILKQARERLKVDDPEV